jgi:hypothetical protein
MNNREKRFTQEQIKLLKNSAEKLHSALNNSKDLLAAEFLSGELGNILDKVFVNDTLFPFEDIPHFELMTRDCLPDVAELYFDFYSLAKYGKPAYEN